LKSYKYVHSTNVKKNEWNHLANIQAPYIILYNILNRCICSNYKLFNGTHCSYQLKLILTDYSLAVVPVLFLC